QCFQLYDLQCPQPLATSCNNPCIVSCATSRVIIYPPPVVVTFPGPILSTCPQETVVGSSAVLEGGAAALPTTLRAEVLCSEPPAERFIPKSMPQC
ncbi:KRFA protein, partial [Columbina picui]|nr:KRFA protein [Columbina picui]